MQPSNQTDLKWGIGEWWEKAFHGGQAGREQQLHLECPEEEDGQRRE